MRGKSKYSLRAWLNWNCPIHRQNTLGLLSLSTQAREESSVKPAQKALQWTQSGHAYSHAFRNHFKVPNHFSIPKARGIVIIKSEINDLNNVNCQVISPLFIRGWHCTLEPSVSIKTLWCARIQMRLILFQCFCVHLAYSPLCSWPVQNSWMWRHIERVKVAGRKVLLIFSALFHVSTLSQKIFNEESLLMSVESLLVNHDFDFSQP